eukprot:SAG22_NODE_2342_length_2686_cov_3.866641_3_plen_150_part_01
MASLTDSLISPTVAGGEGSGEKEPQPPAAAANPTVPDGLAGMLKTFAALQLRASDTDRESLDFDLDIERRQRYSTAHRSRRCWGYSGRLCGKWFLTVVLGLTVGLVAFLMSSTVTKIQLAKLRWVEREFNPCTAPGACAGLDAEARGALL